MLTKTVIVASTNPVKIDAAHDGFHAMFPHERFDLRGVAVESGVNHQPIGQEETLKGALNRALAAREAIPDADYYVGIEGGVEHLGDELIAFAWVVILHGEKVGKAKSGGFILPREVSDLVNGGMELGEADDHVFSRRNSKQDTGSVGILTGDVLTRRGFYSPAVIMALIPFKNPDLSFG